LSKKSETLQTKMALVDPGLLQWYVG